MKATELNKELHKILDYSLIDEEHFLSLCESFFTSEASNGIMDRKTFLEFYISSVEGRK